jgi:hypothetical protein
MSTAIEIEALSTEISQRHKLTGIHLFKSGDQWRVFGFRKDPKGYQASVERGEGATITDAIANMDQRLIDGPAWLQKLRAEKS